MRVTILSTDIVPYPTATGSAVTLWAITQALRERGHEVVVVTGEIESNTGPYAWRIKAAKDLQQEGVRVQWLPLLKDVVPPRKGGYYQLIKKTLFPGINDLFPSVYLGSKIEEVITAESPDVLMLFAQEAIMAVAHIGHLPPTVAVQVNIATLEHRLKIFAPSSFKERVVRALNIQASRHLYRMLAAQMSRFEKNFGFAATTTQWLRQNGVAQCVYLPIPVPDSGGASWARHKAEAQATLEKPKILMVGELHGTPTIAGLLFFAREVLPHLDEQLGSDAFEVHVVGPGTLRAELEEALAHPAVHIRGFVEDIAQEFRSATVLLTPTPFALVARIRIAEGFSFGCCVVAHTAEREGMPELIHEETGLLGSTGLEIALQVKRAIKDEALRSGLERNARRAFETHYDSCVAGARLVGQMERLASVT